MATDLIASAAARIRESVPGVRVFEGSTNERVEGSPDVLVEVRDGGTWGSSPNGARRRVLDFAVLADRSRDADGLPVADDADQRCWATWEQLDALFNDVARDWSFVHSSRRADGPTLTYVPDTEGAILLTARYEVSHD